MDPQRWQQVKAALIQVLQVEPHLQPGRIDEICGRDEGFRKELISLLAQEKERPSIVDQPVFNLLPATDPDGIPERIGAYQVLRQIGRGGLGQVFLAVRADQEYTQRVAIKVIRRGLDTDDVIRRFRAERQILANLEHPHIAHILDGGSTEDGRPYFVMEYVEGKPIDRYCVDRRLSLDQRLDLFATVCEVVHFAHQNLVIHCDLKPANILVSGQGPKLLDFGIAKLLAGEEASLNTLTRLGARPLTPNYASPEQVRGESLTIASDVFALGVVLYELLTEGPMRRLDTSHEVDESRGIAEEAPLNSKAAVALQPFQARLLRNLKGDLDTVVFKAVHEDPRRRYASAAQLAEDLRRLRRGFPVIARPDTVPYRARKFLRRHTVAVALSAMALLLLIGFSVSVTLLWQKASTERENALRQKKRAERVTAFLEELFEVSDPVRGDSGSRVTLQGLLSQGRRRITAGLEEEAELQAALMATMGRVYMNLGEYEEARDLLEEALEGRRSTLGPNHPLVAESQHNLALLFLRMGHGEAAEPLLRQALDLQRNLRMEGAPEYVRGLTNLAALHELRADFQVAEQLYREVLVAKMSMYGAEHREVATALNNLGGVLFRQGDYAAAEPLLRQAVKLRQSLGAPEVEVATALNNLANLLAASGGEVEAEACYRQSLELRKRALGPGHPKIATGLNNLGFFLERRGEVDTAEILYIEALEILDESSASGHPNRAVILRNLASARATKGDGAGCFEVAAGAMEIMTASLPQDHWRLADARSVLGACHLVAGRYGDAETLMVDSYWQILRARGPDATHTQDALDRLVRLYLAWNRPDEAARFEALKTGK